MMSIFGSPFCYTPVAPQPSFTPLFRLLDEFDSYARELDLEQQQQAQSQRRNLHQQRRQRRAPTPTFKPKFDARETEQGYELHGELPGISRENLSIEFTDPQTLVVRGRIVRTYETKPEGEQQTQAPQAAESQPEPEPEKAPVVNNHHATVEDDPEDDSLSIISATSTTSASLAGAATPETASTPKTEVAKPAPTTAVTQAAPPQKVLMHERTVGEFSRTFHFPSRVDQEGVSATLENGVLTVVVPKVKNVTRRIVIN